MAIFGSLLISLGVENGNTGRLENAKQYLGKTSEALSRLSNHNALVLRCVKFIHQLLRIVNAWGSFYRAICCVFTNIISDPSATETVNSFSGSLESYLTGEGEVINSVLESDLVSTLQTWETSTLDFSDELELGHFFASDSQKWFEQTQW